MLRCIFKHRPEIALVALKSCGGTERPWELVITAGAGIFLSIAIGLNHASVERKCEGGADVSAAGGCRQQGVPPLAFYRMANQTDLTGRTAMVTGDTTGAVFEISGGRATY